MGNKALRSLHVKGFALATSLAKAINEPTFFHFRLEKDQYTAS